MDYGLYPTLGVDLRCGIAQVLLDNGRAGPAAAARSR